MATSGQLCQSIASALGVPFETTREHLRNIRRAGMISFKGHGRGAAEMTTLDAARLLIATAASPFVKDSVVTVEAFGLLLPDRRWRRRDNMETQLANMMQRLIDEKHDLAPAYSRPVEQFAGAESRMALSFISAVAARPVDYPVVAVLRRFRNAYASFSVDFEQVRFASGPGSESIDDATRYAIRFSQAGLIQTREVPAWTLAEIAHSLLLQP